MERQVYHLLLIDIVGFYPQLYDTGTVNAIELVAFEWYGNISKCFPKAAMGSCVLNLLNFIATISMSRVR